MDASCGQRPRAHRRPSAPGRRLCSRGTAPCARGLRLNWGGNHLMATKKYERREPRTARIDFAQAEEKTQAAVGLEAEFSIVVDGKPAKPEDVFGSPTAFVREK